MVDIGIDSEYTLVRRGHQIHRIAYPNQYFLHFKIKSDAKSFSYQTEVSATFLYTFHYIALFPPHIIFKNLLRLKNG